MSTNVVTLHAIIDLAVALSLSFFLCLSFTLEYAGKCCRQALGDQTKLFGPRAGDIDAERCRAAWCPSAAAGIRWCLYYRKLAFHAPLFSSRNLMFVFVRVVPLVFNDMSRRRNAIPLVVFDAQTGMLSLRQCQHDQYEQVKFYNFSIYSYRLWLMDIYCLSTLPMQSSVTA